MTKLNYFLLICLFPVFGFTQVLDSIEFISPFEDGYASVQKGEEWAIIDENGFIVIDYRNDLVPLKSMNGTFPIIKNERALIQHTKDDVVYFGYIDIKGDKIIEPQYINASNYKFNLAIVTQLIKNELGFNAVLGKPVVSYEYQEIVIDETGKIIAFLTEPKAITYLKPLSKIPRINSELVSKNLIVTKLENGQSVITKISNEEYFY